MGTPTNEPVERRKAVDDKRKGGSVVERPKPTQPHNFV